MAAIKHSGSALSHQHRKEARARSRIVFFNSLFAFVASTALTLLLGRGSLSFRRVAGVVLSGSHSQPSTPVISGKPSVHNDVVKLNQQIQGQGSSSQPPKPRIPNFLLAGAQKAGTSAIFRHLIETFPKKTCHPREIRGYVGSKKELHYFDRTPPDQLRLQDYEAAFSHCTQNQSSHSIILEATPAYLSYAEQIYSIYKQHGKAETVKIMIVVREPVSRELSWYCHMVRENLARHERPRKAYAQTIQKKTNGSATTTPALMTFEEHMDQNVLPTLTKRTKTFRSSYYALWLKQWFALFDRRQIWVVNYHQMNSNQTDFLLRLHQFLGLSSPVGDSQRQQQQTRSMEKFNHHTANELVLPSCAAQASYTHVYQSRNEELYALLANSSHHAPDVEVQPFQRFVFQCRT